jgi:hypothetical protein
MFTTVGSTLMSTIYIRHTFQNKTKKLMSTIYVGHMLKTQSKCRKLFLKTNIY